MNRYYGLKAGVVPPQEKEHFKLVRDIAARGIVLLENHGILPLAKGSRIALYGYGARNTVYCGLGAASINCREFVSIEEGLERAGLAVTSGDYLDRYEAIMRQEEDAYYTNIREAGGGDLLKGVLKMYAEPFVPSAQPLITEDDVRRADTETAVFVISRNSGEGADRRYARGDYLLLDAEKENLRILSENFKHLIVLLNVGGVIDTSYIRSLPHLSALVLTGQSGGTTGLAAADVLTGRVTPEGKLTATWAEKYEDYPNAESYGAMNGNLDDEWYTEGIYTGYRYFDSFGITPAYPFGYGMSYTDFRIQTEAVTIKEEQLVTEVTVTNTGSGFSGREVVQLYVSAPGGELEKPYQELKGYAKTKLLQPGEAQKLEITVSLRNLASYSEKDSAWILGPGIYTVRVGNSSRNTRTAAGIKLERKIITEQCKRLFSPGCEMEEFSAKGTSFPRMEEKETLPENIISFEKTMETLYHIYDTEGVGAAKGDGSAEDCLAGNCGDSKAALHLKDVVEGHISLDAFVESLSVKEMVSLCVGNTGDAENGGNEGGAIVCAGSGDAPAVNGEIPLSIVPGACDTTRELIESRGIPNLNMADGGSGLRLVPEYEMDENGKVLTSGLLSIHGVDRIIGKDYIQDRKNHRVFDQYTTGLPVAVQLAQTWDRQLCRKCGEIEGKEMRTFGVRLWLAPSMNIHRNPLCGRNFEYYSEDPVVTGECAAAVINGLQSLRGTGATIKHLACNNQEDNRGANNVHVSERALREIYLKGYEIAVKQARPKAMMTSLNLINGIHAANNHDLLTRAARIEWSFDGMVMTDWGTTSQSENHLHKYAASTCAGCIHAGNDLIMPGSMEDIRNLTSSVENGEVNIEELRRCAKRILQTIMSLCIQEAF